MVIDLGSVHVYGPPAMGAEAQEGGLASVEWQARYSTSRDDLIDSFYSPAIQRSIAYDRAVGFFRSSFFSVAGAPTASFALRGGKIRLLCAPDLTADDQAAIKRGLALREAIDLAARRELETILEYPLARRAVDLLAALVADCVLDIRFAVRRDGRGIFHDKVGIFTDRLEDRLSFSGSVNETWHGWHPLGNHESFEVFASWEPADKERVLDHVRYFENLWTGEADGLDIYEAPRAFREELLRIARDTAPPLTKLSTMPEFQPRSLLDHQRQAIENWEAAGRRGILQHATGSGKTITALHAVRDWLASGGSALIVVPSTLLLEQWYREAQRELVMLEPSILLAGGGNDQWRNGGLLRIHTEAQGTASDTPRLTIATLQTAAGERFRSLVKGGDHLLIVADEVHRAGSEKSSDVLTIQSGPRLGLSATPVRARDEHGTSAILDYFGPIIPPIVTLRDAIAAGRLCPYEYFVHLVHLTDDERDEYAALTKKIGQAISRSDPQNGAYLEYLLIRRARVVKQAHEKAPNAAAIVGAGFRDGEHWLVYCDNQQQVRDVLDRLRARRIDAFEYHTAMRGDRDATMDRFRAFGGVLVAIRCLDEGVDIPEVTTAVILASSQTSREFIQRRGRVLRVSPGKRLAVIHDLLVEPPEDPDGKERSPFGSIAKSELRRALEFAHDASNAGVRSHLEGLCIRWGIDITELDADADE